MSEVGSTSKQIKAFQGKAEKHGGKIALGTIIGIVIMIKPLAAPIASILGYVTIEKYERTISEQKESQSIMWQKIADKERRIAALEAEQLRQKDRVERNEDDIRELRR